jgi:hypothetical protein
MSTSNPEKLHLRVTCEDSATEIFIIDGRFSLCGRGIGHCDVELEPGIYKVKVRAGFETAEQHVVLRDHDEELKIPPFSFVSPAPLAGTSKTHDFHLTAAQEGSLAPDLLKGAGSSVFIFVRDWTSQEPPPEGKPATYPNPGQGLSLRDMKGNVIADLTTEGKRSDDWEPWVSCHVQLDPGDYKLNIQMPSGGGVEQTIVASPNWQTQVFLLLTYYGTDTDAKRADLQGGSIHLAPLGAGFKADNPLLRLAELARLGLANERKVLSEEARELLKGKFENPMLGIFGVHLLLLDEKPDSVLLATVMNNLHALLPDGHPDVEALDLYLNHGSSHTFDVPPMLRNSWSHIVQATAGNPQLVPLDCPAAEAALHQWGSSPWLLWLQPDAPDVSLESSGSDAKVTIQLSNAELMLKSRLNMAINVRTAKEQPPKSDSPFAAINKLRAKPVTFRSAIPFANSLAPEAAEQTSYESKPKIPLDDEGVNLLVQSLCIPKASLEQLIAKLEASHDEGQDES